MRQRQQHCILSVTLSGSSNDIFCMYIHTIRYLQGVSGESILRNNNKDWFHFINNVSGNHNGYSFLPINLICMCIADDSHKFPIFTIVDMK
jgi:hypothetical protein